MEWLTESVEFLIYTAAYQLYWIGTPVWMQIADARKLAKYRVAVNFVVQTSEYHPTESPIPNLSKLEWN